MFTGSVTGREMPRRARKPESCQCVVFVRDLPPSPPPSPSPLPPPPPSPSAAAAEATDDDDDDDDDICELTVNGAPSNMGNVS